MALAPWHVPVGAARVLLAQATVEILQDLLSQVTVLRWKPENILEYRDGLGRCAGTCWVEHEIEPHGDDDTFSGTIIDRRAGV